jgi:hypothetical protein
MKQLNSMLSGVDRIEKGYLENPQLAQHSLHFQEPVAVLAFLRSPHLNAGMQQYKCGSTQPLLRVRHDRQKTSGPNLQG